MTVYLPQSDVHPGDNGILLGETVFAMLFGHWAALMGKTGNDDIIALDTGYVWDNYLTLMNLDSGERWQCDTAGVVFRNEG